MIETREELERPGAMRRGVADLGAMAAALDRPPDARRDRVHGLRELAAPEALDLLFRLALESSLRRGPGGAAEVGSPGGLLALAAEAAGAGALPLVTVVALRDSLSALEAELHRTGAWDRAQPFWWSPLPAPGALEAAWRELGPGMPIDLPPAAEVGEALAPARPVPERRGHGAGWIGWRGALTPDLAARIAAELASGAGLLDLDGAGVGRGGRRSSRRSDEVRYLTGLEPDLLERAPALAVFVQRLLEGLEGGVGRVLPAGAAFAPQTAMLARYRAPSTGFAAHLDNPGGEDDNGRTFSLILYLNPEDRPCHGGGLALWPPGASTESPPAVVLPPSGGSAVLFDARRAPHAVEPLGPGPDRWTLVVWLSDRARWPPLPLMPVPALTPAAALLPLDEPPLTAGTVIFRRFAAGAGSSPVPGGSVPGGPVPGGAVPESPVVVRAASARRPRVGMVTTVRPAAAADDGFVAWCRHHLELGADHLVVALDGDEEAAGEALQATFGADRLTVWLRDEARGRWAALPPVDDLARLRPHAERGTATWAVAARQALNASAALLAAGAGELGGEPLDWLVHLDSDELLYLEGAARGGGALGEHFAAVEAAGWSTVRYLDHELLLPWRPGEAARFKRNPAVAVARLGPVGWGRLGRLLGLEQEGRRPYFRAYWNGKGAISVAAGGWAGGVHGWRGPAAEAGEPLLAGPSILHYHLPTAQAFRSKYLLARGEEAAEAPERPFPPSHLEREAGSLIRELRRSRAGAETVAARLDELYAETSVFSPAQIDLLDEAGLVFTPAVDHPPLPGGGRGEAG